MSMAVFEHQEVLANRLVLRTSEDPSSPVLKAFYAGYDRAFVLPDEREDLDGFIDCLQLNQTLPSLFARRHSEQVLTVEDSDSLVDYRMLSGLFTCQHLAKQREQHHL